MTEIRWEKSVGLKSLRECAKSCGSVKANQMIGSA